MSLTFLDAWRLRGRLDEEGGSPRPWLLGIATNVTRNTRRAARRHAAAVSRLPRDEAERDVADEVAARLDDTAELALVRTALPPCAAPSARSSLCACGPASTTGPPPRRSGCPWAPYGHASHGHAQSSRNMSEVRNSPGGGQLRGDRGSAVGPLREDKR